MCMRHAGHLTTYWSSMLLISRLCWKIT
ncbi:unnamed protein product [Staurois parvus]|uniref:Uncharacterized protein n=1 Tax=Staurois parvus TaxID=386267 RepID=A0ABN9DVZ0_9NEOB|nr:unnamed protein product [Staurois parvus]